jgi:hypothetical protein
MPQYLSAWHFLGGQMLEVSEDEIKQYPTIMIVIICMMGFFVPGKSPMSLYIGCDSFKKLVF